MKLLRILERVDGSPDGIQVFHFTKDEEIKSSDPRISQHLVRVLLQAGLAEMVDDGEPASTEPVTPEEAVPVDEETVIESDEVTEDDTEEAPAEAETTSEVEPEVEAPKRGRRQK